MNYTTVLKEKYSFENPELLELWAAFFQRFSPLSVAWALEQCIGYGLESTRPVKWNTPSLLQFAVRFYGVHCWLRYEDETHFDVSNGILPTVPPIGPGVIAAILQDVEEGVFGLELLGHEVLLLVELKRVLEKSYPDLNT